MMTFSDPALAPFSVAALVLIGLVLIEIVTALIGLSASGAVDHMVGFDAHALDAHALDAHADAAPVDAFHEAEHPGPGALGSALDWLNAGRVPILVLIMVLLALFAVAGFVIQALVGAAAGFRLPEPLAVPLALVVALPTARCVSRWLAFMVPRDETYAVSEDDFIGRTAVVTVGPVCSGAIARGRLHDRHGNMHFPKLVPSVPGSIIAQDTVVLVVGRRGGTLTVIPATGILADAESKR